jgi:hypothetical protein
VGVAIQTRLIGRTSNSALVKCGNFGYLDMCAHKRDNRRISRVFWVKNQDRLAASFLAHAEYRRIRHRSSPIFLSSHFPASSLRGRVQTNRRLVHHTSTLRYACSHCKIKIATTTRLGAKRPSDGGTKGELILCRRPNAVSSVRQRTHRSRQPRHTNRLPDLRKWSENAP